MNNFNESEIQDLISRIKELKSNKERVIIAVDGPCASGKTTLAGLLFEILNADVVHMDDFYLPCELRTSERYSTPGGNVHFERVLSEVLIPLSRGNEYEYKAFDCCTMDFKDAVKVSPKTITIVEGSYSCHPELISYYDLKIYMDIDSKSQLERIKNRNGEKKAQEFKDKWIPLENKYFEEYDLKNSLDIIILTGD